MFLKFPDFQYFRYELKERLERLAIRKWINQNPKIIIGITVVSVFVLLTIVIGLLSGGKAPKIKDYKKAWFYDLNTGKLFIAKSDQIPPIDAPSGPLRIESPSGPLRNGGPAGAKAYVFSYADEPNESNRFIGFLETTVPRAIMERLESIKPKAGGTEQWGYGKLIRRVEDEHWVPGNSDEGRAILEQAYLPDENGERPDYCPPE